MTKEEAIDLAIDEHDCKYAEEFVDKIYNDHEVQLKAKDEDIDRLNKLLMSSNYESILIGNKIGESKARSIVAMLFWEWKKIQRYSGKNHSSVRSKEDTFKKAYAMVKEKS